MVSQDPAVLKGSRSDCRNWIRAQYSAEGFIFSISSRGKWTYNIRLHELDPQDLTLGIGSKLSGRRSLGHNIRAQELDTQDLVV